MKKYSMLLIACLCTCANTLLYSAADDTHQFLEHIATIVDPNDAQKEIRIRVRGDEDACLSLLKASRNPMADLHCINARIAIQRSNDTEKNFKNVKKEDLESYRFAEAHFWARVHTYEKIMPKLDFNEREKHARRIVEEAAQAGNIFAKLLQIYEQFDTTAQELDFWHACKLHALINADGTFPFPEVQYAYGVALMHSAGDLGFEGLKHRMASGSLIPRYQEDEHDEHARSMNLWEYQDYCGLGNHCFRMYLDHEIRLCWGCSDPEILLARNRAEFQQFLEAKKPKTVPTAKYFNLFQQHDMRAIRHIIKKHGLSVANRGNATVCVERNHSSRSHIYKYMTATDTGIEGSIPLYYGEEDLLEFAPLEYFLKDALARCRDGEAIANMIKRLEKMPELFYPITQGSSDENECA